MHIISYQDANDMHVISYQDTNAVSLPFNHHLSHSLHQMATAHMNLGAMLHFNGKLAEAEQSYKTALKLKPDDHVTQGNLKKLQNLMKKTSDTISGASRR